jgi:hypothetical protein
VRPQLVASPEIPLFNWRPPDVPIGVDVSQAILGSLHTAVVSAPQELGGILLGTSSTDGQFVTRVQAFEPFEIEYRYGPTFTLSGHDYKRLQQRLKRLRRGRVKPVGLYRTHQRRGLYLDQRDFDLFRAEFRHPACVFLLASPDGASGVRGGLFVWEDDDVRRHATYQEFPIEAPPAPVAIPIPEPRRARIPAFSIPNFELPKFELPHLTVPKIPLHWIRTAAIVAACLALPLAGFFIGRSLGLRDASREASTAPPPRPRVKPAAQAAVEPPRVASPPATAIEPEQKPSPLAIPSPRPPAPAPKSNRDRTGPPLAVAHEHHVAAEAPHLPDPPEVSSRYTPPSFPQIDAQRTAAPVSPAKEKEKVVAYLKPARGGIRHAIAKVFSRHSEEYVPANAIEHPMPSVAADGERELEMAAKIDRAGNVISVKTVQGSGPLASACAETLYKWRFKPARQNGDPVESEMLVRFEFTGTPR